MVAEKHVRDENSANPAFKLNLSKIIYSRSLASHIGQ